MRPAIKAAWIGSGLVLIMVGAHGLGGWPAVELACGIWVTYGFTFDSVMEK